VIGPPARTFIPLAQYSLIFLAFVSHLSIPSCIRIPHFISTSLYLPKSTRQNLSLQQPLLFHLFMQSFLSNFLIKKVIFFESIPPYSFKMLQSFLKTSVSYSKIKTTVKLICNHFLVSNGSKLHLLYISHTLYSCIWINRQLHFNSCENIEKGFSEAKFTLILQNICQSLPVASPVMNSRMIMVAFISLSILDK